MSIEVGTSNRKPYKINKTTENYIYHIEKASKETEPFVTIYCIRDNCELYIKDTLEGVCNISYYDIHMQDDGHLGNRIYEIIFQKNRLGGDGLYPANAMGHRSYCETTLNKLAIS